MTMKKYHQRLAGSSPDNEDRADWAAAAVQSFMAKTGVDDEDAVCDLICDLLHYAELHLRQNPIAELRRGVSHYVVETFDKDGMSHEAQVEVHIKTRRRFTDPYRDWHFHEDDHAVQK